MKSILSVALILCLIVQIAAAAAQQPSDSPSPLQSTLLQNPQTKLVSAQPQPLIRAFHDAMRQDGPRTIDRNRIIEQVAAFKRDATVTDVQLRDGSRVAGLVGDCLVDRFELIDAAKNRDIVRFDQIEAFLEPDTGRVLAIVEQGPIGGVGKPSLKTTLIVMLAVAAALIIFWSSLPK